MAEKPTYEALERRVQELKSGYTQLEKKRYEAELFSEERMTYMSEGLVQTDIRGMVIFINQRLSEMLGYLPEEIIGKCWLDMVPVEQHSIAKEADARRAKGHTDRYEIILRRKDGHKFPVMIGAGPRFDKQSGEFMGTMGVVSDITERRLTEEALRESEVRFRSIYEHTAVGLAQVSLDFKIMSANEAYCNMLGYQEKDLVGKHLKELTHPDVIEENIQKQVNLSSGKIDHYRMEKKFIHKNGQTVTAILDANLIRDVSGNPVYFLGSVVDITERKQA